MRLLWVLASVFSVTGCITSSLVDCGDGRSCPVGYTCGAQSHCFSPEEMQACQDKLDGTECETSRGRGFCMGGCAPVVCGNNVLDQGEVCDDGNTTSADGCNGTCTSEESCGNGIIELIEECDPPSEICSSTCTLIRCGNGIVEPGEVCDDGNLAPGDGCYFDCQSNETCGNGIVDFIRGEQCDDANVIGYDACGQCRAQSFDWTELPQAPPGALYGAVATYDTARRTIVMFGGRSSSNTNTGETWENNGSLWVRRNPLKAPSPRAEAMMTYDAGRQRVILFGGIRDTTLYNDTWEYDGATWTRLDGSTAPAPRSQGVLVYDSVRDRVVLFGGSNGLNDTWELVGNVWMQQDYAMMPPPTTRAAAAFDSRRGVTVMQGGYASGVTAAVWELDANGWVQRADAPTARFDHKLVFDAATGTIVSVGGALPNGADTSDVFDYDGTTWTLRTLTGTPPSGRISSAVAYDIPHDRIVLFGGGTATYPQTYFSDGFAISAGAWVDSHTPVGGYESVILYDDLRRGRVRAFGGRSTTTNAAINATFELDDSGWVTVDDPPDADVNYPAPRREHGLAYDSKRGVVVVFGGRSGGAAGVLSDTWEFSGTTWTQYTGAHPTSRFQIAMTYDSRRGVVVLFGGIDGSILNAVDETWEYDGTWTLRTPAIRPPASAKNALAYDAGRGVSVLFTRTGETWEWNGTDWAKITTTVSPPARELAALAYDPDRRRIVLTAGTYTGATFSDTWEYDGTSWSRLFTNTEPPGRYALGMTYSATQHTLVTAGTATGYAPLDTWKLGYIPARGLEACETTFDYDGDGLTGCTDPECWPVCNPTCPLGAPAAQCQTTPRCGDATCSPIEDCHTCPADCATCKPICGDFYCDPPESTASCPGDC